ncbi:MAG TPA: PTS fructose transporter subunit IIA [Burkholderiaceae bacterium]|nr:PTS fructose transporter subunit IIA [Burkholderiaceae bacterium]HMX11069.1 PTS fructose transporter subunit IIA [Burkholderiaceae bacterium]HMZ00297.1 PTS fructose transporter subunit IIA [Burkholderiaceae bacterium]HNB44969.1 PTS fructose transporter subunit IIA [Burkholderiaceae bacterium]HNG79739.1 PTS fructose transporter subunit IIA [Burkholderiaceae bacterium]
MARILILAHAPLASALLAVARHAFPDCADRVQALDVVADVGPEVTEARARELLALDAEEDDSDDVLILTDVFGATPSNVAQRLSDGSRVRAIAGVNVPMLWRAINYGGLPLDEVVSRSMVGGTQGVLAVTSTRPQNQAFQANAHDPQHHHHQQ